MIDSVERHLTGRRTYTSRLRRLVPILALCAESPKMTTDGCDSLGSHGRVEAAADDSNDSLSSFFEDPTNPDDSMDRNSSLDPDCCERRKPRSRIKEWDRVKVGPQRRPLPVGSAVMLDLLGNTSQLRPLSHQHASLLCSLSHIFPVSCIPRLMYSTSHVFHVS